VAAEHCLSQAVAHRREKCGYALARGRRGSDLLRGQSEGGVGKTTTAVNLAAALARSGAQTLLVDLDPQCNATTGLGRQPTDNHPLVHCAPIRQGVLATDLPRLDLLPGSRSFRDVELLTRGRSPPVDPIARAPDDWLQRLRLRADRLPAIAGTLTKTALSSSTEVFMPIQCEYSRWKGSPK